MKRVLPYYFYPFVLLLVVLSANALTGKSVNTPAENFMNAVIFALIGSLLIGTIIFFYDTKWGPGKQLKILSKSPFSELKEQGFYVQDESLVGNVKEYTVMVSFNWESGRSAISVAVFFNPLRDSQYLGEEELRNLDKLYRPQGYPSYKEYIWLKNGVVGLLKYNFIPPNHDKILQTASELIEILKIERLRPISLGEVKKLPVIENTTI